MYQPIDSPLLVFASRVSAEKLGGKTNKLAILCLDKFSGRSVYRNVSHQYKADGHLTIHVENGEPPAVILRTSAEEIRLVVSNQPASPEPPAQFAIEDRVPRTSILWEFSRKVGRDLIEALDHTINRDPQSQPKLPVIKPPEKPPAENPKQVPAQINPE